MNNVDVVTFTIIFDQVQSLIWFKIFVKKKSFVCIEEIKFAIISEFLSGVRQNIERQKIEATINRRDKR